MFFRLASKFVRRFRPKGFFMRYVSLSLAVITIPKTLQEYSLEELQHEFIRQSHTNVELMEACQSDADFLDLATDMFRFEHKHIGPIPEKFQKQEIYDGLFKIYLDWDPFFESVYKKSHLLQVIKLFRYTPEEFRRGEYIVAMLESKHSYKRDAYFRDYDNINKIIKMLQNEGVIISDRVYLDLARCHKDYDAIDIIGLGITDKKLIKELTFIYESSENTYVREYYQQNYKKLTE